jgi:hypothetical protein
MEFTDFAKSVSDATIQSAGLRSVERESFVS